MKLTERSLMYSATAGDDGLWVAALEAALGLQLGKKMLDGPIAPR